MHRHPSRHIGTATAWLLLMASACAGKSLDPLNPGQGQTPPVVYDWAATADSLQQATYDTYLHTEGTFRQDNRGNTNFNYWWNAHALDALVDGYVRTNDARYPPRMLALLRGIKAKNQGRYPNEFNDDMQWLSLACLRAFKATGNGEYLDVAKLLWEETKKSWSDVFGGGITWKIDTPYEKNAVSNGPATILAMRLYAIEQNPDDLAWARKLYDWEKQNLIDPATGLVWDHVYLKDGQPTIKKEWVFTYNQGTYVGAGVALYEATGDRTYLDDALRTAKAAMGSPRTTTDGLLRDEGQGDGGLFKGIMVRYFAQLAQQPDVSTADRQAFVRFLRFNVETLSRKGIDRPALLVSPDWSQPPGTTTDFSTQLSGLMLVEAAARLQAAGVL